MAKAKNISADAGNKVTLKERAVIISDWAVRAFAAVFFVATSYGYVSNWLEAHQNQTNLSVAGGILIVSVALYLLVRNKR